MFQPEYELHDNIYIDAPQIIQQCQDKVFASAVKFLLDGKDIKEATMLLTSDVSIQVDYVWGNLGFGDDTEGWIQSGFIISIHCQRIAYDNLHDLRYHHNGSNWSLSSQKINWAFESVMGARHRAKDSTIYDPDGYSYVIKYASDLVDMSDGWRERLHELAEHGGIEADNQGLGAETSDYFRLWNGLKFRSTTETRIAQALDKRAVMYFPNCRARLGYNNERKNREPDFLVCHKGNWGILEVDGQYHTGRASDDHDRDRLFKRHGIKVIEHYSAEECFENADKVVNDFLKILEG